MSDDDDLDGFERYGASHWLAVIRDTDLWRDATATEKKPKKTGDMSKLVALLSARLTDASDGVTLSREECELLIDLLSRHTLKGNAGGRKVPAYKRSRADVNLEIAAESARYYQRKGLSLEDAAKKVASYSPLDAGTLLLHLKSKLGVTNRSRRKR